MDTVSCTRPMIRIDELDAFDRMIEQLNVAQHRVPQPPIPIPVLADDRRVPAVLHEAAGTRIAAFGRSGEK